MLQETNCLHLKTDGWKLYYLLAFHLFRCELLDSGRVYTLMAHVQRKTIHIVLGKLEQFQPISLLIYFECVER